MEIGRLMPLLLFFLLTAAPLTTRCLESELELNDADAPEDQEDEEDTDADEKFLVKTEACFDDLGCFSIRGKYFSLTKRPVVLVPQSPEEINIQFLLFTRLNPASHANIVYNDANSVLRSRFSNRRPTKLVVHGYLGRGLMSWMNRIRQALLKRIDCNVIQVGWAGGAVTAYNQATSNTRVVGAVIARLLTWMESRFGLNRDTVHIIGFSLGGQVAGYAGERMRTTGRPIGRITGLDPAGPYFEGTDPVVRLDPTDAQFVDVLHTDAGHFSVGLPVLSGGFGTKSPVGHVDFFVNGGHHQPGCSSVSACDHSRAPEVFIATVQQPESAFSAFPCATYDAFLKGNCGSTCPSGGCPVMGYFADKYRSRFTASRPPHQHYLLTGPASPFVLVHYHIVLQLSAHSPSGRSGELTVQLYSGRRQCGPHKLADKRSLQPRSRQGGVFGCDWPAGGAAPELRVSWSDDSWFTHSITIDGATLTEMVKRKVHRYCSFGSLRTGVLTRGKPC